MRIAYVCADAGVPVFGSKGSSIHVQEVVRAMLRDGCTVELFAAATGGDAPRDLRRLRLHEIPRAPKHAPATAREEHALRANDETARLLQQQGPFDLVYERHSLWSFAAMEFARDLGWRSVLEINAPLIDEQTAHRELVLREEAEQAARRAFSAARALIGVSAAIEPYVRRFYPAAVHVIPNGVNAARFPADLLPSLPAEGRFTIGFLGTLKPWHGIDALIETFDRCRQLGPPHSMRLLVVGDGPERANLEQEIDDRGLHGDAILTGAVTPEAVPPLLASMDATLAPYPPLSDFYFSPLKIVESMAAGVPVIASRIGQIETLIRDRVDGVLCRAGAVDEFVAAVRTLRDDGALRRRLGAAARKRVLEEFTWEANWRRIRALALEEPREEAPDFHPSCTHVTPATVQRTGEPRR